MRIYVPLQKDKDKFLARTSEVDIKDWRNEQYVKFFEDEIKESHFIQYNTVKIDGVEFKGCEVFAPNNEDLYDYFVVMDEEFIPLCVEEEEIGGSSPDNDWIIKWIDKSRSSENYYHNYKVDLSTKYIPPRISWDDDTISFLNHPNSIRRDSRILLIGQPGAGKTSFARFLTQTYLNDTLEKNKIKKTTPLVFYFQLRDFAYRPGEFQKWINKEEEEVGRNYVANKHSQGRVIFVFDGLDELNKKDRFEFSNWLDVFINNKTSIGTIVTSRDLDSLNNGIWRTFKRARLLPFDRNQVNEYCSVVLGGREKSKKFVGVIESNPDLQEFLKNPFSLSLALGMYLLRGSLPFNIGVLCKELVSQLVERWDARRGINRVSKISAESINATLGRLAYRLQSNKNAQFSPEDISDLLPYEIESLGADAVLQDLVERTGLICELNPRVWSFSHRYLQDFFCANYLVERASGLDDELDAHGSDEGWVDVWRQVGQLCQDPEFFALSGSRFSSDAVKSVDRMVSSLLSHEGLSKTELNKIVDGLTEEVNRDDSNLPRSIQTGYGADLNCSDLDSQSIEILANIVVHLSYLKDSNAGLRLLDKLKRDSESDFGAVAKRILQSSSLAMPIITAHSLQVHLEDDVLDSDV